MYLGLSSPLHPSQAQFYAHTVTSARFRTNGISPATRHPPEVRSPSAEKHVRVKSSLPGPEFGWYPAHLGLPHLFSRPTRRRKKLPRQRKTLSRLTTTRGCTHKRRLRPFPPRKSLCTDEFPQHGERNKQPDRPEHLLSTAFSLSLEPQVSLPSAPQIVTFRVSPNPNYVTMWRAHYVLFATSVA